jgi:hypothetical protein
MVEAGLLAEAQGFFEGCMKVSSVGVTVTAGADLCHDLCAAMGEETTMASAGLEERGRGFSRCGAGAAIGFKELLPWLITSGPSSSSSSAISPPNTEELQQLLNDCIEKVYILVHRLVVRVLSFIRNLIGQNFYYSICKKTEDVAA